MILQGAAGQVVGRPELFHTVALTRLVAGDSATAYARMFEGQQRRSRQYALAGGVALIGGAALVFADRRRADGRRDGKYLLPGITLEFVGLGLAIPQAIYSHRARSSLSTALWWHNLRFAR